MSTEGTTNFNVTRHKQRPSCQRNVIGTRGELRGLDAVELKRRQVSFDKKGRPGAKRLSEKQLVVASSSQAGGDVRFRNVFAASGSKWQVRVSLRGKKHYVGVFSDRVEGARAADRKAVELGMPASELNFPGEFQRHVAVLLAKSHTSTMPTKALKVADEEEAVSLRSGTPPLSVDETAVAEWVKTPDVVGRPNFRAQKVKNASGFRGVYPRGTGFYFEVHYNNQLYYSKDDYTTAEEAARQLAAATRPSTRRMIT